MTLDLRNRNDILSKYNKVIEDCSCSSWLILDYEGNSNKLKVGDYGDSGIEEMLTCFNSGKLQYGIMAMPASGTRQPKIILIRWQGDGVPSERLAVSVRHAEDLRFFLKGIHAVITARNEDDIDLKSIEKVVSKLGGVSDDKSSDNVPFVEPHPVSSVYRPIKPNRDIDLSKRDQFWKKIEEEENDRRREEEQRSAEKIAAVNRDREELSQRLHEELRIKEHELKSETPVNTPSSSEQNQLNSKKYSNLINGRKQLFEQKANELRDSQIKITHKTGFTNFSPAKHSSKPAIESTDIKGKDAEESSVISTNTLPAAPSPETSSVFQRTSAEEHTEQVTEIHCAVPSYYEEPPCDVDDNESSNIQEPDRVFSPNDYGGSSVETPLKSVNSGNDGSGLRAVALWDYQAADDTEISFDPDDIISEIDQIDEGWWRGRGPDGKYGLFPANYVSVLPN